MSKKKIVYLFGAGAVIPWGGPKTSDLTELLCESGFFCKREEKRITQKIYETLLNHYSKDDINFETILNVIEELIVFYSSRDYKNTNSILFPFLQKGDILDTIFNFEVIDEWGHRGKLKIPHTGEYISGTGALNNQSPRQFFLELLYSKLLDEISAKIHTYSWHTKEKSKIQTEKNSVQNENFYNWINLEVENKSIVRLYTLNYDRLFSIILKIKELPVFEGANSKAEIDIEESLIPFDIKKITTDFDCNVHYNLHGSVYWGIETRNSSLMPSIKYYLNGVTMPSNQEEQPIIQAEKGKTILPTTIVTGYQKTQKISLTPFRQMFSAFDRDCMEASKIIIVGYSFGDFHINESIKIALHNNPNIEIEIIDPNFSEYGLDEKIITSFDSLPAKRVIIEKSFDDYLYNHQLFKKTKDISLKCLHKS
jgi:hypothetical protein